ncbi:hypothetical protein IE077_000221 [Cardiosporidium cionae]|uniref:Uncharacterized protein n=1 Tax=Cardiosporidium cionae TaxID=476202 RepID=A0ABQ7JCK2_9APIC|nr:hypothetical protein IE077_000221 [Cardiosporidium cionae]|eukprot:KAF8821655.1 hypothetical protein IE077_000221 [Cardiosporidium cionae]
MQSSEGTLSNGLPALTSLSSILRPRFSFSGSVFSYLLGRSPQDNSVAHHFGQANQAGKPGPVLGTYFLEESLNRTKSLVLICPRSIERFSLNGQISQHVAIFDPITCFLGEKVSENGTQLFCGTQGGAVCVYDALNFQKLTRLLPLNTSGTCMPMSCEVPLSLTVVEGPAVYNLTPDASPMQASPDASISMGDELILPKLATESPTAASLELPDTTSASLIAEPKSHSSPEASSHIVRKKRTQTKTKGTRLDPFMKDVFDEAKTSVKRERNDEAETHGKAMEAIKVEETAKVEETIQTARTMDEEEIHEERVEEEDETLNNTEALKNDTVRSKNMEISAEINDSEADVEENKYAMPEEDARQFPMNQMEGREIETSPDVATAIDVQTSPGTKNQVSDDALSSNSSGTKMSLEKGGIAYEEAPTLKNMSDLSTSAELFASVSSLEFHPRVKPAFKAPLHAPLENSEKEEAQAGSTIPPLAVCGEIALPVGDASLPNPSLVGKNKIDCPEITQRNSGEITKLPLGLTAPLYILVLIPCQDEQSEIFYVVGGYEGGDVIVWEMPGGSLVRRFCYPFLNNLVQEDVSTSTVTPSEAFPTSNFLIDLNSTGKSRHEDFNRISEHRREKHVEALSVQHHDESLAYTRSLCQDYSEKVSSSSHRFCQEEKGSYVPPTLDETLSVSKDSSVQLPNSNKYEEMQPKEGRIPSVISLCVVSFYHQLWIGYTNGVIIVVDYRTFEILHFSKRIEDALFILHSNSYLSVWKPGMLHYMKSIQTEMLTCDKHLNSIYIMDVPPDWKQGVALLFLGCTDGCVFIRRVEIIGEGNKMRFLLLFTHMDGKYFLNFLKG